MHRNVGKDATIDMYVRNASKYVTVSIASNDVSVNNA
jgi:hypothetical protein